RRVVPGGPAVARVHPAEGHGDEDGPADVAAVRGTDCFVRGVPPVLPGRVREVDRRRDAALAVADEVHLFGAGEHLHAGDGVGEELGVAEDVALRVRDREREDRAPLAVHPGGHRDEAAAAVVAGAGHEEHGGAGAAGEARADGQQGRVAAGLGVAEAVGDERGEGARRRPREAGVEVLLHEQRAVGIFEALDGRPELDGPVHRVGLG
ncbi:MAG: hypothetical protein ACK559_07420, partial [bacterium]